MPTPTMPTAFRFGEFRLLSEEGQLFRHDEPVPLTARAFAVLLALVEQAGRLVDKEALMQRVWSGLVVEDNNLAVQVGVLRKLLGADAIVTVPGRGYRFALPLAAPASPPPPRGGLPAFTAPLLGRDEELRALCGWVEVQRLVTVVGAGGIGKSRLAQAAGHEMQDQWRDGVWWLELAGLADPALLVTAMAQSLGISIAGPDASPAALAAALGGQEMLLVIDNCEHLLDAVALMVDSFLKVAPRLHVLATSQEPLRLDAEQQFRLNPLAVPADAATPGARDFGALALLVSRVRATQVSYTLSDHDLPLAIDLCRRLDGLPLAIELAAARVPLLGLRTVRDRLDERFRLLTAGSRTALRRHQTLRAAIDWSHGLLDEAQRSVFRRLGVFSGGFTLPLAQALCSDEQADEWAVLDQLAALVDKSLVVLEAGPGPRYRLLESARAYALEQLAIAKQTGRSLARHAQVMLAFLRRVDDANLDGLLRTDEYAALTLPELDNLRAAYAWAVGAEGDRGVAVGLAAHVGPLIDYSLEFSRWLQQQHRQGACSTLDEATEARLWRGLAAMNMFGFIPVADQLQAAERCAVLYRRLAQPKRMFTAMRRVAVWATLLKDTDRATAALDEAEAVMQTDWSAEFRIELLRGRAVLAGELGQLDRAIELTVEALRIARDVLADWRLEVMQETNVADLLWQLGRHAQAAEMLGELVGRLRIRPASDYELMDALESQLWILSEAGDIAAATSVARQALPVLRRMPRFSLAGCAHLLMRLGHHEDATRVLGARAARAHTGLAHEMPNPVRLLAATEAGVQAALAPARLQALRDAGAVLAMADVCDLLAAAVGAN